MWILRKMIFWKCKFCQKWDFRNVNFFDFCPVWLLVFPDFWKKSHIENSNFTKFTFVKSQFFAKFTFIKSRFSQNSHFQSLIFLKIHIFRISYLIKFTFLKHQFLWKFRIKCWFFALMWFRETYMFLMDGHWAITPATLGKVSSEHTKRGTSVSPMACITPSLPKLV